MLRLFDPWRSELCTCPLKWVASPYTGCGHRCLYCYASSYIPRHFQPRAKKDFVEKLRKDLEKVPRGALIEMATSSDPYTPPEQELRLTRKAIHLILSKGFRLLITTKSDLVVRDLDLLTRFRGRVAVAVTITTLDENLARRLEPGAPPPSRRVEAVKILSSRGVPVTVRLDPIIPFLNDDPNQIEELVARVAEAGARQVTCSTYKAKPDNLRRMMNAFPDLANKFRELYLERGARIHGYRYLEPSLRFRYLTTVQRIVLRYGMAFETCREGFPQLNTPGFACDGSSYAYEESSST